MALEERGAHTSRLADCVVFPSELCLSAYKSGDGAERGSGARQRSGANAGSRRTGSRAENMWLLVGAEQARRRRG